MTNSGNEPPLCEQVEYTGNDIVVLQCLANAWLTYLEEYAAALEEDCA